MCVQRMGYASSNVCLFVSRGEYIVHPFKACHLSQSSKYMNLLLCYATLVSFFRPFGGFKTELQRHNTLSLPPFFSDVNLEMDVGPARLSELLDSVVIFDQRVVPLVFLIRVVIVVISSSSSSLQGQVGR